MAAPKISNIIKVSLDGIDYGTKTATFSPGGFRKETQYASGKISGRTSTPICSRVQVTYEMTAAVDVEAIRQFSGNVTVENDIDQVWKISEADVVEPPEILPNGGGVQVTLEGSPAELIL